MFRYLLLVTLLASSVVQAAPCAVTEGDLLGSWEAAGASGLFEQMAFEGSGDQREFNSWRHERPEISAAAWRLQACQLTILDASGPPQMFDVARKGKRLVLTSDYGRSSATFRKLEEKR